MSTVTISSKRVGKMLWTRFENRRMHDILFPAAREVEMVKMLLLPKIRDYI